MSKFTAKERALPLPPQTPGVSRMADDSTWLDAEDVQASANRCNNLTGPARSMCYKALYDVTY